MAKMIIRKCDKCDGTGTYHPLSGAYIGLATNCSACKGTGREMVTVE